MTDFQWRYIDDLNRPFYIEENDICIYAREHHEGGYDVSESNQLIFNYKKPVSFKNTNQWYYKEKSISQFARELSVLNFSNDSVLIPAATSKPRDHAEYDSRLEETLIKLKKIRPDLLIHPILDVIEPVPSAHSEGGVRNPNEIIPYLRLLSLPDLADKTVFIIDDVITTGGHYKAYQRFLAQQYPGIVFNGIFWAKRVFSED